MTLTITRSAFSFPEARMQTRICANTGIQIEGKMSFQVALIWLENITIAVSRGTAKGNMLCRPQRTKVERNKWAACYWLKRSKNWQILISLLFHSSLLNSFPSFMSHFSLWFTSPDLQIKGGTTYFLYFGVIGNLAPTKSMVSHNLYNVSLNSTLVWNRLNRHCPTAAAG